MASRPFRRRAARLGGGIAFCALALVATAVPALAAPVPAAPATPGLSAMKPGPGGYFDYTLSPGAATSGTVVVHNLSSAETHYLVYVAGATTSPVGGVSYGQPQANPAGTAAWLQLSVAGVDVPPGAVVPVHFSVAVPQGTAPGDYVAAIAAQAPNPTATAAPVSGKRSVRLLVTTRVVIAVVVHVPGPGEGAAASLGQPRMSLQQQRRQVLTIPIQDTGSVLMKPYLTGNLANCSGGPPVLNLARQLDTFVPHTSIDYPWYLNDQVLPAGCYKTTIALTLSAGGIRLAGFTGTLRVQPAVAAVQATPGGSPIAPAAVHAGLPIWLIPALAVGVLLLLITGWMLWRSRAERRRLLQRLADSEASGARGSR